MNDLKLPADLQTQLRCPICHARLEVTPDQMVCSRDECATHFPIVDGVPILINEARSVFSLEDFKSHSNTTFRLQRSRLDAILDGMFDLLPNISMAVNVKKNYLAFRDLLLAQTPAPNVLVIGGSIQGQGMEVLARSSLQLVATDVSFGPLTVLICDAHDVPFADGTFDGVIAQAVLEHVVDPHRCVGEIYRVMKSGGVVYAETPFMQQVHMGRFDFTRFTHSGHRWLFRHFDEIAGGPICGPGMALAWSYQYFLLSFSESRAVRGLLRAFASLTSFYLKYVDYYLIDKPAAVDAASGFYFMGRKTGTSLSDHQLLAYYKGRVSN